MRLKDEYKELGMRRTTDGILLVHQHNHPHILMLQIGNAFFKLPGDQLAPGESDLDGIRNKLNFRLAPPSTDGGAPEWEVVDCISNCTPTCLHTSLVQKSKRKYILFSYLKRATFASRKI
eukprot:NODE_1813_length_730_cov_58.640133_g1763_i0.p1 GENE.NODE_1813_length_730_cov_58.640133_g1763_i0~~NODE_1813_length_730_cov_58.640133_g1763_i0.p1  ORF type:complete len:120 (+),score=3.56 NODE_1813_length_730_cov_58.640133_g1763_i0:69-428(+)